MVLHSSGMTLLTLLSILFHYLLVHYTRTHISIASLARYQRIRNGANDRHEVAYIFGQLCSPHSVPSLLHVLREDDMVRHEAAEALGGIASDGAEEVEGEKGEDVLQILREWAVKEDAPIVVRESCQVAIDMWEVSFTSLPSPLSYFPIFSSSSRTYPLLSYLFMATHQ
jgi:hypothetical protein